MKSSHRGGHARVHMGLALGAALVLFLISSESEATPVKLLGVQSKATKAAAPKKAGGGGYEPEIRSVFGKYGAAAVRVARCESTMNPRAHNSSGASGLFQIKPATFASTSQRGRNIYDVHANIRAAYEIFVRDGHSWKEWACKP